MMGLKMKQARVFNMDPDLNKQVGKSFCAMCCRTLKSKTKLSFVIQLEIFAIQVESVIPIKSDS